MGGWGYDTWKVQPPWFIWEIWEHMITEGVARPRTPDTNPEVDRVRSKL